MAVTGLLITAYLIFEAKKPNDSGNIWLPKYLETWISHPYVINILGTEF
jgi:hypothetical protein